MGKELGEDVGSDEIDQMADEIASGKGLDESAGEGPDPGVSGSESGDIF